MNFRQTILLLILVLASCFLCFSLSAQTSVGLVAHFKFSNNMSNSIATPVTATGVSTTFTTNNAGLANRAVQFGGSLSSYIDFTDNGTLDFTSSSNFTISFGFFFNGNSTSGLIDNCLNYGGWGVWLWSTTAGVWNLQFNYRNNSVGSAAGTAFTVGVWHHVAAVRNNGTISLYIDGVLRESATEGTGTPAYPINMIAGAMAYSSFSPPRYNPFGGKIDELRIYNRALSLVEIQQLTPYALPLTLGDFTALRKTTSVELNWQTLSEINTSHFEIERSEDGIRYTGIGSVSAAGNSSVKKNYRFTDLQPPAGTAFYRLKMTDIDQAYQYSRVVAVRGSNSPVRIDVFPNPATDILQVQIPSDQSGKIRLSIANAAGQVLWQNDMQLSKGTNSTSIELLRFPPGPYLLVVDDENGKQGIPFIRK